MKKQELIRFPDPRFAPYGDIVTIGGALSVDNLLAAYRHGIFPWPIEGWPLTWFCPEERAILEFDDLHIPHSLARAKRQTKLRFTIDEDFGSVIRACAGVKRSGEQGTWITPAIIEVYTDFHERGQAHSVEAWEGTTLVGGLYGVEADGAFSGESMFFLRSSASKLALLYLIQHLAAKGLSWIDIQMMTPHMKALGARLIDRNTFLEKLADTQRLGLKLF